MNISKNEQRVLHELALGGRINYTKNDKSKIQEVMCYTRNGYVLSNCTLEIFKSLKNKKLISSKKGMPYTITKLGLTTVRSQMNQR